MKHFKPFYNGLNIGPILVYFNIIYYMISTGGDRVFELRGLVVLTYYGWASGDYVFSASRQQRKILKPGLLIDTKPNKDALILSIRIQIIHKIEGRNFSIVTVCFLLQMQTILKLSRPLFFLEIWLVTYT